MNKVTSFVIFLCIFSLTILNAQTDQGRLLIGVSSTLSLTGTGSNLMSFGYSSSKTKSDADGFTDSDPEKTISLNLSPKLGYFIVDNLAAGLDFYIAILNEKDGDGNYDYQSTLLSGGPFIRYYIPTGKVFPFMEVNGAFGVLKTKFNSDLMYDDKYKESLKSIGLGFGLAAPLGNKVTFDIMVGYNSLITKDKIDNPDNERTVTGTLGLRLGLTVFLGSI